jgi:hypothetical protein
MLLVIDHGSDDGSTAELGGVHRLPLPRTPFDDQDRADLVSSLQAGLLKYYDVVIYTDCDEMLVADPARYGGLTAFLSANQAAVIAPTGLNVLHVPAAEPALDLAGPILTQRRHVRFNAGSCKPCVTRVPLRWAPGFHFSDQIPDYRPDLFLFHLGAMDRDITLRRLAVTRSMAWSERAARSWGWHQRVSDAERLERDFLGPARLVAARVAPFDFTADLDRLRASVQLRHGHYEFDYFDGTVTVVPARFQALF